MTCPEIEVKTAEDSTFISLHPDRISELKEITAKEEKEPEEEISASATPSIPSSFILFIDINMSIKLKTTAHPEGEWVTLWCDDEPSPSQSEGLYFFWAWWKSSYKKDQKILKDHGIPISKTEYSWHAPCAIAIPYEYVIQDPYRR